jgi:hypothetical protein
VHGHKSVGKKEKENPIKIETNRPEKRDRTTKPASRIYILGKVIGGGWVGGRFYNTLERRKRLATQNLKKNKENKENAAGHRFL